MASQLDKKIDKELKKAKAELSQSVLDVDTQAEVPQQE